MFASSTNCVFFLIILFLFTSTSVFSDCYNQRTCGSPYGILTWCCNYDETCGDTYQDCKSGLDLSPFVIAVIIVGSIFVFIVCLTCCIHCQQRRRRLRNAYANSNTRLVTNPYPQGPARVVRVRPIYNVGVVPTFQSHPSIYEAPPPSYETATAGLPPIHLSSPPPPVTMTV